MSPSVASSEPSSVGLPPFSATSNNNNWSLEEAENNNYNKTSSLLHHHDCFEGAAATATAAAAASSMITPRKAWYPSLEFASEFASAGGDTITITNSPSFTREQRSDGTITRCKRCPICGGKNQDRITTSITSRTTPTSTTNSQSTLKSTGLYPTTTTTTNEEDENGTENEKKTKTNFNLNDFELASMLQTTELEDVMINNSQATLAAAMGVCWVCIVALASANSNNFSHNVKELVNHQQQQQQALASSFSILENFQDEYNVSTTFSPKATTSINVIEHDYYSCYQQQQQQQQYSYNGHYYDRKKETTMGGGVSFGGVEDATTSTVVYIGEYNHRGQQHGPHGELIWDNGDRYVGSFVCGKRTGTGTMFHRDGTYCYRCCTHQSHVVDD
jgi:hypothetical protein